MPSLPAVDRRTMELAGLAVPFVELTGSADGPTLTVISGGHGCEYASMDGVRCWLRALEGRELRGRARAVPVLNVTAFAARSPFVVPEDGKNLNRSFPGDPAGTLAERLAWDAFTQLILGSDAYVDAHCGDLVEALQPFALYEAGPAQERARELAAAYGLQAVDRAAGRHGLGPGWRDRAGDRDRARRRRGHLRDQLTRGRRRRRPAWPGRRMINCVTCGTILTDCFI